MPYVVDYIASALFFFVSGKFVPKCISFCSVLDKREFCVAVDNHTLWLPYQDVDANRSLPGNPLEYQPFPEDTDYVPLYDFDRFVVQDFVPRMLDETALLGSIGCLDTATFYYLSSVLPMGSVRLLNPSLLRDSTSLTEPELFDPARVCLEAADRVFSERLATEPMLSV